MSNIIEQIEKSNIELSNKKLPPFSVGDSVSVQVNVVEGERKRKQAFEGVVIAKRNRGINSSFIVRKISSGEGVERTFQVYSPLIDSIRGGVMLEVQNYFTSEVGQVNLHELKKN